MSKEVVFSCFKGHI